MSESSIRQPDSDSDGDTNELVAATETLARVSDCRNEDGTVRCPNCDQETKSERGLVAHNGMVHGRSVTASLLGDEQWRETLEILHRRHGMSPWRIAQRLPTHTGSRTVQTEIDRFGIEQPDESYGLDGYRHPDDPFETVIQQTYAALKGYLDDPRRTTSSARASWLVEDVDAAETSTRVGQALTELDTRGKVTRAHHSSSDRWMLADGDSSGEEEEGDEEEGES